MSIEALRYVKNLKTSPSGESVTINEKAILWYLADYHREEERAAWPSVPKIAASNNIKERAARYLLRSCILKGIIWRDNRRRENGSSTSNLWRFNEIDGEPPTRALIEEEKRQMLGRKAAEKANQAKRGRGNPQECGGTGCKIPQEADAAIRSSPCGILQGADAESRRGRMQNPAGRGC